MSDSAYSQVMESLSFSSTHPYFYLEITFLGIIAYLLLQKAYTPKKKLEEKQPSEEEIEKLVAAFTPDPLVPAGGAAEAKPQTVISTAPGARVRLKDDPVEYTNFVRCSLSRLFSAHPALRSLCFSFSVPSFNRYLSPLRA